MDSDTFRRDLPEFADIAVFPKSTLNFWIEIAEGFVSETRWGTLRAKALALFVAHNVSLSAHDIKAAHVGGIPGTAKGLTASKSLGSASISYDNSSNADPAAGHWGTTQYGQRYRQMGRLLGAGAVSL